MKISQEDVLRFKQRHSDENKIIADIIQRRLYEQFEETIIDVGAGTGDITSKALAAKRVVQVDILNYHECLPGEKHRRVVGDFFDYLPDPEEKIGTLFFSHVLQFLDRDIAQLNHKVQTLAANKIITVTNVNDAFMGELIRWTMDNFASANPETDLSDFPSGYRLCGAEDFKGHVTCASFGSLGKQVRYLMDTQPSASEEEALENFLRENLSNPTFSINQKIKVYTQA
jgi:SAM-dependent methyltransferase